MKFKIIEQLLKLRTGADVVRLKLVGWIDDAREGWPAIRQEMRDTLDELKEINWPREAKRVFDRLSDSVHAYLTASFILGSIVMWFTGIETGLMVLALMIIPVAMTKIAIRLFTRMADDRACEEHFTALMDSCMKNWEESGSFREHLMSLLEQMDQAHVKMVNADPGLARAYARYYEKNQQQLQAQILMMFGFPVTALELKGEGNAVNRMMSISEKMRFCWESAHGPYVREATIPMERFLWLMRRMPEIYDLR